MNTGTMLPIILNAEAQAIARAIMVHKAFKKIFDYLQLIVLCLEKDEKSVSPVCIFDSLCKHNK